jgi:hypothetical protein
MQKFLVGIIFHDVGFFSTADCNQGKSFTLPLWIAADEYPKLKVEIFKNLYGLHLLKPNPRK